MTDIVEGPITVPDEAPALYAENIRLLHARNINLRAENIRLRAEVERLRAALEPLACTCDRPNGAACSRSEVDCPFWSARAALEEKQ